MDANHFILALTPGDLLQMSKDLSPEERKTIVSILQEEEFGIQRSHLASMEVTLLTCSVRMAEKKMRLEGKRHSYWRDLINFLYGGFTSQVMRANSLNIFRAVYSLSTFDGSVETELAMLLEKLGLIREGF